MAGPGNQHCANCIGTLSFPMPSSYIRQGSCKQIVDLYLESFADVASPGVGERRHGPDGGPEPGDADEQPM